MEKTVKGVVFSLISVLFVAAVGIIVGQGDFSLHEILSSPVTELRFFRLLAALLIGGALSLSGMVFQAVLRNPLAEPYILGISAGAGVGAAAAFISGLTAISVYSVPVAALCGALLTLFLVLRISIGGDGEKLLLSGVIAGTICSSVLMFLLSTASSDEVAAASWWLLGDLQSVNESLLLPMGVVTAVALLFLIWNAGVLDVLALGDREAFFLGVDVKKQTIAMVVCASLLAAMSVALAGAVGFCGLVVPHVVRRIFSVSHRKNVLFIFLWGGIFLMICDILSRIVLPGRELPIGIATSVIGGPVFLWILNKRH
ncbi:MAG: iron ABC transporter permease [Lentisphaeria bacterium]|nr:iron ABC transporter permease [Lentisphaeria bacterium]